MSTTEIKRPLAEAEADACDLRDMLRGCWLRWDVAGSIRRRKPEVSDVDHVVIPDGKKLLANLNDLTDGGMFSAGELERGRKWGPLNREVVFRGFRHDIYLADGLNLGCQLLIRTGPSDFSRDVMMRLHKTALRQAGGYLRYARSGEIYSCPNESVMFEAAGMKYIAPERRG